MHEMVIDSQSKQQQFLDLIDDPTLPNRESEIWCKVPLEAFSPRDYDFSASSNQVKVTTNDVSTAFTVYNIGDGSNLPSEVEGFINQQSAIQEQRALDDRDFILAQNIIHASTMVVVVNETLHKPLRIQHCREDGFSYLGRVFIWVKPNVQCTIIEEFDDQEPMSTNNSKPIYYNSYSVINSESRTQVDYLCRRQYSEHVFYMQRFFFSLCEHARVKGCYSHLGGSVGKSYVNVDCNGSHADFRGLGAGVHSDREFHDFEVLVNNRSSNVSSIIIYKMVLRDYAHSVFNGNLNIPTGFKRVRSLQTNHNILLDRRARAESMPRLIIASDDVSCDHGATVGQLSEEALFYLMSRGLNREQAYYIMVEGFLNAIIEEFPVPEEHHQIMQRFREKIGGKIQQI